LILVPFLVVCFCTALHCTGTSVTSRIAEACARCDGIGQIVYSGCLVRLVVVVAVPRVFKMTSTERNRNEEN
jgi:hypothetical protein